ncbi:hypothetical protein WJX84_001564 [Apatococcus fuscideae]|uniref:Uncharacterized protein n=1 Tax=Apatococcus fuscideae TaxID=2026836 RepID=A0AAW1TAX5_9CHLO
MGRPSRKLDQDNGVDFRSNILEMTLLGRGSESKEQLLYFQISDKLQICKLDGSSATRQSAAKRILKALNRLVYKAR